MASVHDVAAYILERHGPMSTWKLQKLLYYAQAWHVVWDDEPLFDDEIEAWANGPVIRSVYRRHRGQFSVERWPGGDPSRLTDSERGTVDAVLSGYGRMTGRQLSALTHSERPWAEARRGLGSTEPSDVPIPLDTIQAFYAALDAAADADLVEEINWSEVVGE